MEAHASRTAPRSPLVARSWLLAAVILLVAACGGGATPQGDSTSEAPTSGTASPAGSGGTGGSAGASGAIGPCGPNDIAVEATSTGGAAGSRGADVSVTAVGEAACQLTSKPMIAMMDPSGQAVLQSPIQIDNAGPVVSASAPTGFTYEISNWCSPTTSTPWTVVLATSVGTVPVTGIQYETDDLPPCNGPGQPATLTTSSWAPASN